MAKVNILHIEDDDRQRRELTKLLRSRGFSVRPAASGKTGLEILEKSSFNIIICDLNMPKIGGLTVLKRAKKIAPLVPVIILTAHGSIPNAVKAIRQGAYHFVLKPIDINELESTIIQAYESARLQIKLVQSEDRLKMIMNSVPDIIYSLDPNGNFLNISPAAEAILGYKPREFIGKSVFRLIHPDDRDSVIQNLKESIKMKDSKTITHEFRMISNSGEIKHFEIKRKLVFENGKIIRNDGIARDVTDRKKLEKNIAERTDSLSHANKRLKDKTKQLEYSTIELGKANIELLGAQELLQIKNQEMEALLTKLSSSRDELQTILDSSLNVIFMVNNSGEIVAANSRITDYFNLELKNVITKDIFKIQKIINNHFENPEAINKFTKRMHVTSNLDDSESIDPHRLFEHSFKMKDEKHRRVSIFSGPVKNKSGNITGRLWIYIDVTKMKEADELLHTVVNASPVPLIITRISDGEILFANDELGDLIGTTARELIGKKSPDFYYDPDGREIVLQKIRDDGYLKNHEVRLKKADGSVFWAIFSLVATEIDGESVVIGGILDIQTRKLMEDAIRWERNFVSAVLDTAGALVTVLDSDGSIVQFNKACQETTGYLFEEVSGKKVWDLFIPPEDIKDIKGIFNNIKAGMFPNAHENCWLTKEGSKRLISWSNTAILNDEGKVEHVIATGIDITERKEAEEKLILYKEIFMNTSDGITIINPDGKIIDRNPAHREYSGLTDEELYGRTPGEFMCDDSLKRVDAAIAERGSFRGEIVILNKKGDKIDIDLSLFPIYKNSGELSLFVGMGRDISEKKKSEKALRISEERFRSLVENATDIIFSMTADGTLTYMSPQFEDATGFKVSDYIGKRALELMHPDDRAILGEWLSDGAKQDRGRNNFEYRFRQKSGGWRWFVSTSSVLRDESGDVIEIIGIAHDITEMKQVLEDLENANQTLKNTQTQLVQSEKMASLGMLVAGIAHEINTPVGAVSSMHDTLMRAIEKLKKTLETELSLNINTNAQLQSLFKIIGDANKVIDTGASRVNKIVKRLRSFARLDEAELKKVNIHEGLEDTLALIHHEIKHKADIIKKFGDIPAIACFPGQLNQVFLNLLVNSTQAIKDKGEITISTERINNKIKITFEDTGTGISPENLRKIFDPGFTTKGVGVGTGLGLSICYQIIQDHHGEIMAESEPGKGTKFTIILPTNLEAIIGNGD